jgi:hypothetical protein
MQINIIIFCLLVLFAGCSSKHIPVSESLKSSESELERTVYAALEKSPTYKNLKNRTKAAAEVVIDEEKNGWVEVDIGAVSEPFFHRWATLKVDTKTGKILKLGTDEKLEDKWSVEYEPPKRN